jgi:hypothetical protein
MLHGGCLCGAVRYELDGELGPIVCCHCSMCRKAQGSAFATNAPVEAALLRVTQGEEAVRAYVSSPGKARCFCSVCGSPLWSRREGQPGVLRLRLGSLDSRIEARPTAHIHVASKADWFEILDGLPQHAGFEPGR